MTRPYIICHMVTSIDGKVTGDFLFQNECAEATEIYYRLNRERKSDGFICGRVTMEGSFTGCRFCALSPEEELFLLTFIKNRGSIKDVERELGVPVTVVDQDGFDLLDAMLDRK